MKFEKNRLDPLFVEIGGVEYPIRFPVRGMAEVEDLFKENFYSVIARLSEQKISGEEITKLLYVMLKCGGVELELEDLQDVDFNFEIIGKIMELLGRTNKVVSKLQDHKQGDKKKPKTA